MTFHIDNCGGRVSNNIPTENMLGKICSGELGLICMKNKETHKQTDKETHKQKHTIKQSNKQTTSKR